QRDRGSQHPRAPETPRPIRRGRRDRRAQTSVLLEDAPLELPQLSARLEAELVHKPAPARLVGGERIRLPRGPIEAEHQLGEQTLPERVLGDEPLELTHQLRAAPELELGVNPGLERQQPPLLE